MNSTRPRTLVVLCLPLVVATAIPALERRDGAAQQDRGVDRPVLEGGAGIETFHLSSVRHSSGDSLDAAICGALQRSRADVIFLAGYMKRQAKWDLWHALKARGRRPKVRLLRKTA